jgi:hypothetical protein
VCGEARKEEVGGDNLAYDEVSGMRSSSTSERSTNLGGGREGPRPAAPRDESCTERRQEHITITRAVRHAQKRKDRCTRLVALQMQAACVRSKACIEVWIKGKMVGQVLIFN